MPFPASLALAFAAFSAKADSTSAAFLAFSFSLSALSFAAFSCAFAFFWSTFNFLCFSLINSASFFIASFLAAVCFLIFSFSAALAFAAASATALSLASFSALFLSYIFALSRALFLFSALAFAWRAPLFCSLAFDAAFRASVFAAIAFALASFRSNSAFCASSFAFFARSIASIICLIMSSRSSSVFANLLAISRACFRLSSVLKAVFFISASTLSLNASSLDLFAMSAAFLFNSFALWAALACFWALTFALEASNSFCLIWNLSVCNFLSFLFASLSARALFLNAVLSCLAFNATCLEIFTNFSFSAALAFASATLTICNFNSDSFSSCCLFACLKNFCRSLKSFACCWAKTATNLALFFSAWLFAFLSNSSAFRLDSCSFFICAFINSNSFFILFLAALTLPLNFIALYTFLVLDLAALIESSCAALSFVIAALAFLVCAS